MASDNELSLILLYSIWLGHHKLCPKKIKFNPQVHIFLILTVPMTQRENEIHMYCSVVVRNITILYFAK